MWVPSHWTHNAKDQIFIPMIKMSNHEQSDIDYQKRIETILESFTDGFFEVDSHWIVSYWNRTAEVLLEKPRAEIIGRNLWEAYPEAVELKFYTEYHRAMTEQISVRFEEFFYPKQMWFEVSVFPNGQGLSIYFKDITERKATTAQLELERRKYRDLFDQNPLPLWVYDTNQLRFLDVNQAAVEHYGYSRTEFLQMTIDQIRPEADLPAFHETLKTYLKSDNTGTHSVRHCKKNGEVIEVVVKGTMIEFNGMPARMVVVVDRTSEIRAELAKQQSVAKLREISWIQTHQVRRPLSNIMGLVSLLERNKCTVESATLLEKLRTAAEELDSILLKLTNNGHQ